MFYQNHLEENRVELGFLDEKFNEDSFVEFIESAFDDFDRVDTEQSQVEDNSYEKPEDRTNVLLGSLLVLSGLVLLVNQYVDLSRYFNWLKLEKIWPVILILLGIKLLWDSYRENVDITGEKEPVGKNESGNEKDDEMSKEKA
jgi:hypothetical protein